MKPNVLTGPAETVSRKPLNLHKCTKDQILAYFENAYGLNEWIFTSLKDESVFLKTPDKLRLPLIFYYGHTAVVYVNKLLLAGLITESVNKDFEILFETGVDEMTWDDTENYRMGGAYRWPALEDVRKYRLQVRKVVREVIQNTPLTHPIDFDSKWWAVVMGIEHERIHLETSSVLIRQLPVDFVEKPPSWKYGPFKSESPVVDNPIIRVGNSSVKIGKDAESPLWGWDNEYGRRIVDVPSFEASKYSITNREFLKFVKAGGYETKSFWSVEGWKWRTFREARHPSFWICNQRCKSGGGSNLNDHSHCTLQEYDREYGLRLMFDVVPLPQDWPAEVNYHEAKAFCKWKGDGYRMPTEAEHHVMRALAAFDSDAETDCSASESACNVGMEFGSSTPVNMYPPSATGFCDLFGNVWEWTEDHFNGLPGFVTNYLYDDFSSPCFDGNHTMILGGSWISTGDESTRYARFSFRRHFYQHLGFRVARTVDGKRPSPVVRVTSPVYISEVGVQENLIDLGELDSIGLRAIKTPSTCTGIRNDNGDMLSALLSQQYGEESSYTSLLQKIRKLSATVDSSNPSRALVIGCGPGRIAFELTKEFDEVIGCDTSGRCIDYANIMKANAMASHSSSGIVTTATDGFHDDMRHDGVIRIMKDCKPERVVFKQLTWIPRELGQFDVIIVDGLDRMQNKRAWLAVIPSTLKRKEGLAIVVDDGNTPLHGCCDSMATVKHEKCQQANAKTLASVAMSKM